MSEEIETDKWRIFFESESQLLEGLHEGYIKLVFRLKNKENSRAITDKTWSELKQDLKDLEKFRIIKQGKKFLEE